MTRYGGASGCGVVFKLSPDGTNYQVLYSFTGGSDGQNPFGGVVGGSGGKLYGMTRYGGASGCGVVFKLSPDGTNYQVLHTFTGGDGCYPYGDGLFADSAGTLYGMTDFGGSGLCTYPSGPGCGVVFKLSPDGTNYQVLHSFTGGSDGDHPAVGFLIAGSTGTLYGAASGGGGGAPGHGVVFKLSPDGTNYQVLHTFTGGSDGDRPTNLIADRVGNLYGTTNSGGASGRGTLFKLSPDGSNYQVLYSFTGGSDGLNPFGGLIADRAGNLYGTTFFGGASNLGTVFTLTGVRALPPTGCSPTADAALTNVQFPAAGEVTYDLASPTRTMSSTSVTQSSNIGSSSLPAIQSGGHSATGGVLDKANSSVRATFKLLVSFTNPTFSCIVGSNGF
jgi:uncharacterized repeat protein (TIGR03803 family)